MGTNGKGESIDHDADLKDLLDGSDKKENEMAPLRQGTATATATATTAEYQCGHSGQSPLIALCCAYFGYLCDYAPRLFWTIGCLSLGIPMYFVIMDIANPTENFGTVHDFTDVKSIYDLKIGDIDHWCLKGDDSSCGCQDPLEPSISVGVNIRAWSDAHKYNAQQVRQYVEKGVSPDIAFLGESVIEEMGGRWMGHGEDPNLKQLANMFDSTFSGENGQLDAVALGLAGDMNPSVLYRLLNGEMPSEFNPKIWWLQLGLNDLGRAQCSEDVVVLGILRIVEEILTKKKGAKIVINGLLPMPNVHALITKKDDFKDSFAEARARAKYAPKAVNNTKKTAENDIPDTSAGGETDEGSNSSVDGDENTKDEIATMNSSHITTDGASGGKKKKKKKRKTKKKNNGRQLYIRRNLESDNEQQQQETEERSMKVSLNHPSRHHGSALRHPRFGRHNPQMYAHLKHQKKYAPGTRHERKVPLWTSITSINDELSKFASKTDNVYFFDVQSMFAERVESDLWTLNTDHMTFRGHPTVMGYKVWESAIHKKANEILSN